MQITFQPLQLLSRVAAVFIVVVPLAFLVLAVDDYEQEAIGKMTHQELIAFIQEAHANSYLGAYVRAAIMTLILVVVVEAVAFVIRLTVGLFGTRKPADAPEEEFVSARTNNFR